MRITDLRCVQLGRQPLLRIVTDGSIDGYSQIESFQLFVMPMVDYFRSLILDCDPTNVEAVMLRVRRRGGFKPWGSIVSAIEIALWDIAGKAAGVPVYKLLGGKIRDRVRVYNGGVQVRQKGHTPDDYADAIRQMLAADEGFTLVKHHIAFHNSMPFEVDGFSYAEDRGGPRYLNRGRVTNMGIQHVVDCVSAMNDVLVGGVELALDLGPGWFLSDAIILARELERFRLAWLEDLLTGDAMPYVSVSEYKRLTESTSSIIHTGEQLYLRNNYRDLIDAGAVSVIGPDPCDVGGIAELKWIAEYADLRSIMVAPHGIYDGLFGLAAHVQLASCLPDNFIAFEYPVAEPRWWYGIVEGLPKRIVNNGFIDVLDEPGLGISIVPELAVRYLADSDASFFG